MCFSSYTRHKPLSPTYKPNSVNPTQHEYEHCSTTPPTALRPIHKLHPNITHNNGYNHPHQPVAATPVVHSSTSRATSTLPSRPCVQNRLHHQTSNQKPNTETKRNIPQKATNPHIVNSKYLIDMKVISAFTYLNLGEYSTIYQYIVGIYSY